MNRRDNHDGLRRSTEPTFPYYDQPPAFSRVRRGSPWWVTVLVGITTLSVGFALGAGSKHTATAAASPATASKTPKASRTPVTPTLAKPATAEPSSPSMAMGAGIGSMVAIRGDKPGEVLEVTLVKVVDPAASDNEFSTPDPGKHFIGIQFKLVNKGTTEYDDDPQIDVKVKDAQGQSFAAEAGTTLTAGQALDSGLKLPAGDTALGYVTFQLPSGSKAVKVQYTVNLIGNTAQWTLG